MSRRFHAISTCNVQRLGMIPLNQTMHLTVTLTESLK